MGGVTGRSDVSGAIHDDNATCLRGLVWMSPEVISPDMVRAIGALTVSCYRKIPGVGPRAVKAGNAGVYALSQVKDPLAIGQLALLKVKVKFGSAQKGDRKSIHGSGRALRAAARGTRGNVRSHVRIDGCGHLRGANG